MSVTFATIRSALALALLATVVVLAWPFARHAFEFGMRGMTSDMSGWTRLYAADRPLPNAGIFIHMIAGAVITLAAPLQLVAPLRNRFPVIHRWNGRALCAAAVVTALGGLVYIVTRRTVGGPVMDVGFALYGICVLAAAVQTVRFARAGDLVRHREWALRMFFLAIGSWLYRVHYALWYWLTGGIGTAPGFSGPFDLVQTFAFYVPYLLILEIVFAFERRRAANPPMAASQPAE